MASVERRAAQRMPIMAVWE